MDFIGGVVGTAIGGPIGGVVGSMVGDLLGGGGTSKGNPLGQVLGGLTNAFGSLFAAANPLMQFSAPAMPLPFSPGGLNQSLFNPANMFPLLQGALTKFNAPSSAGGFDLGKLMSGGLDVPQDLDAQMNAAQQLMMSSDPSKQIEGMQQMMKLQQLITAITTVMQTRGKLAMSAIHASQIV